MITFDSVSGNRTDTIYLPLCGNSSRLKIYSRWDMNNHLSIKTDKVEHTELGIRDQNTPLLLFQQDVAPYMEATG